MSIGDILAIATFLISLLVIAYGFGAMANRLEKVERDLNDLGVKVSTNFQRCDSDTRELDRKISGLANNFARLDERCAMLEREETIGRMRG
ncbi:hypothetical protein H6F44_07805 [Pseudanabaena sp. FACHB-1277]|uniref:Uncharacterized protein n=1 Tax=Pseudanabaena cinerea FACHB-1277 TaxID=2949581 RepID=A0A926URR5_9CYAN|nr:hypothetical protein [Pseudanabaena cinerea]MBD2150026.1 hypothetical protein [Pseudanabaena cinerea FACHB-1277]